MSEARHVLSILFGAAFTILVMWSFGCLLFRHFGIRLYRREHDILAAATGGVLLSFAVFLLCTFNAARASVFLGLGIAAIAIHWRFRAPAAETRLPPLPRLWKLLFLAPFALYAVLYLSNSLAPEISPDGQTYHLGLVYRFFREHGFRRITTNLFANLSLGAEMLFLFAFTFGRNSAAATVHCCYLLAMPLLILSYARRIGRPRVGVCAAMIVFLSPVAGIDGVSAYNDVALANTAFALFYLLEIWRDEQTDALLIPIGLLAGFCFAIKITGFVAPLYAVAVILLRRRPRALVPVMSCAAAIGLPWLIKTWLWVGNPFSPFLNRIFPNPYVHVVYEDFVRSYFSHYELTSFKPWFWTVTVGGELAGQIGPVFLLSPIALLALRSSVGRRCLLAALFFLIPYPQNIGARFLIPALPFVALGIALALEFSPLLLTMLVLFASIAGLPAIVGKYSAPGGSWRITEMPVRAALRILPQDTFLGSKSVLWITASMLDYYVPSGKRVWSTTPVGEAYAKTDVMISYQSAEGDLLQDVLTTASSGTFAPTWNLRFTFPRRRLQHLRVVQTAIDPDDVWSINEVNPFNGASPLPRTPAWRLDAKPFRWDVALAFDGNPVTRWRSWEPIHSGMHVDVDFGAPFELDRVELKCAHDQGKMEIHLESCDGGGCAVLPANLDKLEDPPIGDLRHLATHFVKSHGIDYMLIDDPNWTAADMRKDPARWGMELIAERAGNRLYRIQ